MIHDDRKYKIMKWALVAFAAICTLYVFYTFFWMCGAIGVQKAFGRIGSTVLMSPILTILMYSVLTYAERFR